MNDEQHRPGPDQPRTETESSDYQHKAQKLVLENKMLRAVLDSMPDNISIKDLEGRYIFDNTSHCRFLGATNTADVVGKTLFDFLPPVIAAKFRAEELCKQLVAEVREFAVSKDFSDDVCLIAIEVDHLMKGLRGHINVCDPHFGCGFK